MEPAMVEIDDLSLYYGEKLALKEVTMSVPKHRVTAYHRALRAAASPPFCAASTG